MQVFVIRRDLGAADTPVRVIASYPDEPVMARDLHGTATTVFTLPASAVVRDKATNLFVLASNWREAGATIVKGEAQRRILEVFSEVTQRNSVAQMQLALMTNGSDVADWPTEDRDRKYAIDDGWSYVAAVRQRAKALQLSMPNDPTNDGHWPTVIGVVKV